MIKIEVSNSSNVSRIEYDADTEKVYITFKNGTKYAYSYVNKQLFEALVNAPSKGKFIQTRLKNHKPSTRIL